MLSYLFCKIVLTSFAQRAIALEMTDLTVNNISVQRIHAILDIVDNVLVAVGTGYYIEVESSWYSALDDQVATDKRNTAEQVSIVLQVKIQSVGSSERNTHNKDTDTDQFQVYLQKYTMVRMFVSQMLKDQRHESVMRTVNSILAP